jgi:hypothetical protein
MHLDPAASEAVGSVVLLLSPEGSSRARATALGVEQQHVAQRPAGLAALHSSPHGYLGGGEAGLTTRG